MINLRAARKSAARDAARATGDANAAKFGRSKVQKRIEQADADRAARHLDGHRQDKDQGDG
ncbi:MAG: DUF4169 family protein [Paracoccus sp.]|nr:DUF4169 family protein [Paracoccus sp. (in: a-proteobacteria)]